MGVLLVPLAVLGLIQTRSIGAPRSRPASAGDIPALLCLEARDLIRDGHPGAALASLEALPPGRLNLPPDFPDSVLRDSAPATVVLQLGVGFCHQAEADARRGERARARAYLEAARTLAEGLRRSTPPRPGVVLALDQMTQRTHRILTQLR
jgi:hypothetical protein